MKTFSTTFLQTIKSRFLEGHQREKGKEGKGWKKMQELL
jgi:hypothetical protein